jgi:hypothetical protein
MVAEVVAQLSIYTVHERMKILLEEVDHATRTNNPVKRTNTETEAASDKPARGGFTQHPDIHRQIVANSQHRISGGRRLPVVDVELLIVGWYW